MQRDCKNCYYADFECNRRGRIRCWYTPTDDDIDEIIIDRIIEEGRDEFFSEWREYATQYDEDYFMDRY